MVLFERSDHHVVIIDRKLKQQLEQLAQREGVTLFMLMLATYKVLLYRYCNQKDICVGTSFANRDQEEVSSMIGFLVQLLALRSDLSKNPTFKELLHQVKLTTLQAFENKDVPFTPISIKTDFNLEELNYH